MPYYSERQRGPKPRAEEAITPVLWKGISLVSERFYNQNYFAKYFPAPLQDNDQDKMLEAARGKFLNPDMNIRKEALEVLWDAFERIKTVEPGKDKKTQITAILAKASHEPTFLKVLDDEGNALTWIGNNFMI